MNIPLKCIYKILICKAREKITVKEVSTICPLESIYSTDLQSLCCILHCITDFMYKTKQKR